MKTTLQKIILVLVFSIGLSSISKAQIVYIPDSTFRAYLNLNYPTCMVGDSIDGNCQQVINTTDLNVSHLTISDLTGLEVFINLDTLDCSSNQLSNLPSLPSGLTFLNCYNNQLASLPSLPSTLQTLECPNNQLTSLPFLPSSLTILECGVNPLTSLPTLPSGLTILYCAYSQLTSLPSLPSSIYGLVCGYNLLTSLPSLPSSLIFLECYNNQLASVPSLPSALQYLRCQNNQLTSLPSLPLGLIVLDCHNNQLTNLPSLPSNLTNLYCSYNPNLSCLPDLKNVTDLNIDSTGIQCLPSYGKITTCVPPLNTIPLCGINNINGCDFFWNINGSVYFDTDTNCIRSNSESGISNQKINLFQNGSLVQQTYSNAGGNYDFDTDSLTIYQTVVDTTNLPFSLFCPASGIYTDTLTTTDSLKYNRDFALKCNGVDLAVTSIYGFGFRPASVRQVNIKAGDYSNNFGGHCASGVSGIVKIVTTGPGHYVSPASGALTPTIINGDTLTYIIADFGTINYNGAFNFNLQVDTNAMQCSQLCIAVSVTSTATDVNLNNNLLSQCFTVRNSYDPNEKVAYPANIMEVNGNRWLTYTINFQNTGNADAIHIKVTDTLSAALDFSTFTLLSYSKEPIVQLYNTGLLVFNFPNINLPDSISNELGSHGYVQFKIRAKDSLAIGSTINNTANIYFDFNAPVITNTTSNTVINCSLLQASIVQNGNVLSADLANANYQWINCTTNTAITNATAQNFTPSIGGSYAVVIDYGACKDTSACIQYSATGINELNASALTVTPNPFNESLQLKLDRNYNGTINIYNLMGEVIYSKFINQNNLTIATKEWTNGLYIIRLQTQEGVVMKKVVKD